MTRGPSLVVRQWVNDAVGGGKRVAMAAIEILDRKYRRGDRERGKVRVRV